MDPLSHPPRNFREIVEADLRRAARGIIKVQDELDPQFRIATPEGDYHLAVSFPTARDAQIDMLRRVGTFLTWKRAMAVTFAVEMIKPDAVVCFGITDADAMGCMARINRVPKPWTAANFGPVEWIPPQNLDAEFLGLLRVGPKTLTPADVSDMVRTFGPEGPFPAVHIEAGELRRL